VELTVVTTLALLALALDIWVSWLVARLDSLSRAQKGAWFVVVWFVPLVGAILARHFLQEDVSLRGNAEFLSGSDAALPPGTGVGFDASAHDDSHSGGTSHHDF
jgi:hypothetical protein